MMLFNLVCALGLFFIICSVNAQTIDSHAKPKAKQRQVFIVGQVSTKIGEDFFHQGLQAYLKEDYDLAIKHWLKSAENQHAQSVFNIGRMWLEGQVPEEQIDIEKANQYFSQAANLGYEPAKAYLNINQQVKSSVARKTTTKTNNKNKTETNKTKQKTKLDSHWTIQLYASKDIDQVNKMIHKNNIKQQSTIFHENNNGDTWYKLLYGTYLNKKQAIVARDNLPAVLRVANPWVRNISIEKNIN